MTVAELIAYLSTKEPSTPVVILHEGLYVPPTFFKEFVTKHGFDVYKRRDNMLESGDLVIVVR